MIDEQYELFDRSRSQKVRGSGNTSPVTIPDFETPKLSAVLVLLSQFGHDREIALRMIAVEADENLEILDPLIKNGDECFSEKSPVRMIDGNKDGDRKAIPPKGQLTGPRGNFSQSLKAGVMDSPAKPAFQNDRIRGMDRS